MGHSIGLRECPCSRVCGIYRNNNYKSKREVIMHFLVFSLKCNHGFPPSPFLLFNLSHVLSLLLACSLFQECNAFYELVLEVLRLFFFLNFLISFPLVWEGTTQDCNY